MSVSPTADGATAIAASAGLKEILAPLPPDTMRRTRKTLTAVTCAVLTLTLAGCGKDTEDFIVGVWRVLDETVVTTVSSDPDGWDLNGTYTDMKDFSQEPYPDTWTFSGGGILTITPGLGGVESESSLYSVDDNTLTVLSNGDTVKFNIVSFKRKTMTVSTRWYEFYTAGRYTVNSTFQKTLNLEKL